VKPPASRVAVAALLLGSVAIARPGLGAEAAAMTVHTLSLPAAGARLESADDCRAEAGSASRSGVSGVIVVLDARQRFRLTLRKSDLSLEPLVACVQDQPEAPPDALPGTRPAQGTGELRRAWLAEPTLRYRHHIFVQPENAASVRVLAADGREFRYDAPAGAVIEDRLPRLVRAWGSESVLTVLSTSTGGAAVLLLGLADGRLQALAESAPIGTAQRWLNPIGVADFDGDGQPEIAAVITPHIGGWLTLFKREGRKLAVKHRERGFSNHAIGTDELRLAAMFDANGDGVVDLAVPGADRRSMRIVTFAGGRFRELQRVDHATPIASAIIAADLNGDGNPELAYALGDGSLVVLAPNP